MIFHCHSDDDVIEECWRDRYDPLIVRIGEVAVVNGADHKGEVIVKTRLNRSPIVLFKFMDDTVEKKKRVTGAGNGLFHNTCPPERIVATHTEDQMGCVYLQ